VNCNWQRFRFSRPIVCPSKNASGLLLFSLFLFLFLTRHSIRKSIVFAFGPNSVIRDGASPTVGSRKVLVGREIIIIGRDAAAREMPSMGENVASTGSGGGGGGKAPRDSETCVTPGTSQTTHLPSTFKYKSGERSRRKVSSSVP
jgi:hypothetical protein